ncbi:MAG: 4Fe-4S dicluster domain-containing protein [Ignavibacteria bacterium]|nr:4Fe-4S dicluster domain-containing protein [Ignavibacteria bacterium]
MSKLLKINKGVEASTKALLGYLLDKNKVKSVITLNTINANQGICYSLIAKSEELKDAVPLFPFMPNNEGKLLSRLTIRESLAEPIAVVARPCEIRAFIELVKRNQGRLENYLFISHTCPGVYPLETNVNGSLEKKLSQYWNGTKNTEIIPDIRTACKSCIHFVSDKADIIISLIGETDLDTNCNMYLNTNKGEEFAAGMEGEISEKKFGSEGINLMQSKREEERKKLFGEINIETKGIEGLLEYFGKCIGCHGCSNVCPICYCNLCFFDSQSNESQPSWSESELDRKGALRLPSGTIFYHLGRLAHISISCVGCGMCSDVCPVNIPISTIFSKVGESVQKAFDYFPGMNVEEPIPFGTYKEEEFTEIGEQ